MKLSRILAPAALSLFVAACGAPETQSQTVDVSAKEANIRSHLEFLADDDLKGRQTGSEGHEIASNYIVSEFKRLGLEPAGDDGTYYQRIPFRKSTLKENSASMTYEVNGEAVEFEFPKEFITGPSHYSEQDQVSAPLVFVGYGMEAPEFGLNDYEGLNVEGKIVVMLTGRPEFLPSEEGAHLSNIKSDIAREKGAIGIITLHTPMREEVRKYETSVYYTKTPRMTWLGPNGLPKGQEQQISGSAYLDDEPAKRLFANAPTELEAIFTKIQEDPDFSPKGFELDGKVTLKRESRHEEISSPNVAAVLPGSDEKLKDEYVVYTAHSDHIGVIKDMSREDNINNGAMDNASGVSVMLETARLFVESDKEFKRSIMFLSVTAEEKGLLGADYFANNPTVPLNSIVANVNLDMPVLLYDFADVVAFGASHSTLGETVSKAAKKYDTAQSPDPMPEQAIFTRSDHYTLVKKGIPAVFLMTGFNSRTEGEDGGEVWGTFFAEHYHKPSDGLNLDINYEAGARFTNINFAIGEEIANAAQRPQWLEDSFFGKQFND
ncbi:M28 family metallopeptidase [Idiomarina zobellii]|uniref:Peptidase M28 n=1 Tax=Idiomarina zobellii TaxID=86103 RepID=A0A837NAK8_9GAMM|nr:M28 family metallopeptidase [Idiomarina zobellii]KPD24632.1 peptidase M28 [Idiomarina zobellii]SDF53019.1 Zn-dependent amino-or carboxypeptidase, M28 family [Idiomarina zobellii]